MKIIIASIALMVFWVSVVRTEGTTTRKPLVKLDCKFSNGTRVIEGFFADEKDPTVFHQCSHGQHIADFRCVNNTVFNETVQVCVVKTGLEVHCPAADGIFSHPTNAHKFIVCNGGHGFVENCPTDLIFDEAKKQCEYNDKGVVWESDPTTVPTTPSRASTQEAHTTPEAKTNPPTVPTSKPTDDCTGKGYYPDPANKHMYFICHNGKKIHTSCPDGLDFDQTEKQCQ